MSLLSYKYLKKEINVTNGELTLVEPIDPI
jgi:hypothetical protein